MKEDTHHDGHTFRRIKFWLSKPTPDDYVFVSNKYKYNDWFNDKCTDTEYDIFEAKDNHYDYPRFMGGITITFKFYKKAEWTTEHKMNEMRLFILQSNCTKSCKRFVPKTGNVVYSFTLPVIAPIINEIPKVYTNRVWCGKKLDNGNYMWEDTVPVHPPLGKEQNLISKTYEITVLKETYKNKTTDTRKKSRKNMLDTIHNRDNNHFKDKNKNKKLKKRNIVNHIRNSLY